jgi:GMP synthase (glutamine-hydrolysing)
MKPVACIRNAEGETFGLVREVLREQGLPILEVDAWSDPIPEPDEVSAYAVFGGDQHIHQIERDPYLITERDVIRRAVEGGRPVLGICLGSQLLAAAMGGVVRPASIRQCRFAPFVPTEAAADDPLFSAFSEDSPVFHWHEDTFELPPRAVLLSRSDEVANQAFRIGPTAWASQFHLEVTDRDMEKWIAAAGEALERKWGKTPDQLREESRRYLADQQARARKAIERLVDVVANQG